MSARIKAVKVLSIGARTAYPIVSAFEYATLKDDEVVREFTQHATIYFILQRPLMLFDNLDFEDGILTFDVIDGTNPPLHGSLDPAIYGIGDDDVFRLESYWYRGSGQTSMPFREVAAFRIHRPDGSLASWLTPQKLLFDVLAGKLSIKIEGDVKPFLQYRVHYIGKAIEMRMWERLSGHKKFQDALMREKPLSALFSSSNLEISVLMLSIARVSDHNLIGYADGMLPPGITPIITELDADPYAVQQYSLPPLVPGDAAVTNEVEAMLVSAFRPAYNDKKFANYPRIANGARAAGYSYTDLEITRLPAELFTEHHRLTPHF